MLSKYMKTIGNTPMVRLVRNIYMKLEGHNPSGSIKDRSINNMIKNLTTRTTATRTTATTSTKCLVTSGSAGLALYNTYTKQDTCDDSLVVIPLKYSQKKGPSTLLNKPHIKVHKSFDSLVLSQNNDTKPSFRALLLDDEFINILDKTNDAIVKYDWTLLDQHHNTDCVDCHKKTASEIMHQLPTVTDVVCTTGTGGTAAGLIKYLPNRVTVHARTSVSGEIDGLGDVGRYDNYCDTQMISGYYDCKYKHNDAIKYMSYINDQCGMRVGESTGVALWLANEINVRPNMNIVVISADGRVC